MNYEKPYSLEKPKGRQKLLLLEKEERFVFHGSTNQDVIHILEPRQAYGASEENNQWEKDGYPAVFLFRLPM